MNKYEPTLQERVPDRTCGFGSIMFKLNMMIQKPIGLPSLAMPLQGTMPPPARASFT